VPLDPRIEAALAVLDSVPVDRSGTAAERRARIVARQQTSPLVVPGPELHQVHDADADGVPVRVYRPRDGVLPVVVYLHGGGWWLGGVDDSDPGCRRRAAAADCVVVSVDYRLAPEHPFPAAFEDGWTALRWVVAQADDLGVDPARVVLAGASAGGNLAAAVALRARDAGGPARAGLLLEVPGMDLTMSDPTFDLYCDGYVFTREDLAECVQFYAGGQDLTSPFVSPAFGDPAHLPPMLITTAEYDPLRDPAEQWGARAAAAGVEVQVRRWDGQVHGSMEMEPVVPDVAAAYRSEITDFLARAFARVAPAPAG
jgi:acetyl esterase